MINTPETQEFTEVNPVKSPKNYVAHQLAGDFEYDIDRLTKEFRAVNELWGRYELLEDRLSPSITDNMSPSIAQMKDYYAERGDHLLAAIVQARRAKEEA